MSTAQGRPTVKIAPNNPVFDLPVIVGIEEGLFAKAGLDVSFSATYADREKDSAERPIMARLKEQMFDCGSADSYNVCEWASIDRLERDGDDVGGLHFTFHDTKARRNEGIGRRREMGGDVISVHLSERQHCRRDRGAEGASPGDDRA